MTLIERYITAVTNHLPQNLRDEVGLELRSNIWDMLPDNPTESQIIKVLEDLGSPSELAMEYAPEKRYLIGPALYPTYIKTIKLVLSIVAIALTAVSAITVIFTEQSLNTVQFFTTLFSRTVGMVFEGLIQTLVITTFVFAILDRNNVLDGQTLFNKRKWKIGDLKDNASEKSKISKGEATVGICFNLFFATLFLTKPNFMPIAILNRNGFKTIPVFNFEVLKPYLPFIIGLFILSAAFGFYKLIIGHWNRQMAIINTFINLAAILLVSIMAFQSELISEAAKLFVSSYLSPQWFVNGLWVALIAFVGITLWDIFSGWRKAYQ